MSEYQIRDAGAKHRYYWETPNMIDDIGLTLHAFRLYCHLKRVAGDGGLCWQSTETLAKACKMGSGSISRAKQELVDNKLIEITSIKRPQGGRHAHNITIIDIWASNELKYKKASSLEEVALPRASSLEEIKKNSFKNTPSLNINRETEKPDGKTKSGETSQGDDDTQKWLDEKEKNKPPQLKREPSGTKRALEKYEQRQTGNAEIENFIVKLPERVRPIARVFCEYFGRAPIKKENSYWRTEWESQADLGLLPKHISAAIADMDNNGLHIKSPASVTSISERFKREGTANAPGTGVTQVWKGGERIR